MVLNREERVKCILPVRDTGRRQRSELTVDQKESICCYYYSHSFAVCIFNAYQFFDLSFFFLPAVAIFIKDGRNKED